MPINIPSNLPAYKTLIGENVFVLSENRAVTQDIRPLKIAIVNLMPTKIETETQLLRLLSNTPLQVDVSFIRTGTYNPKHEREHLSNFYTTFDKISGKYFDALLITGAPVEKLPFEEVAYWDELCRVMDWSKTHVFNTIHICWGAQAALYYHYGVPKRPLGKKLSGIFPQRVLIKNHPLFKGFDDIFYAPQSRYTEVREEDVENNPDLIILSSSDVSGVYIIADKTNRQIFISGHAEYDRETLKKEYFRDLEKNLNPEIPENYFPNGNIHENPVMTWNAHAELMYSNWLNFCVYQETPFNLEKIEPLLI